MHRMQEFESAGYVLDEKEDNKKISIRFVGYFIDGSVSAYFRLSGSTGMK